MSISKKLMTTGAKDQIYVDDVFSTYLYTGNGADQDIVNGIDLDGEGGLVWAKSRTVDANHRLFDTERGSNYSLMSDGNTAQVNHGTTGMKSFNDDGFTLGPAVANGAGVYGGDYASWTFRKAPKFFDVVTYRGDNAAALTVPHNLGVEPGMIIIKSTDTAGNPWYVYHRGCDFPKYCTLNSEDAQGTLKGQGLTAPPTAKSFTVVAGSGITGAEQDYVAYLFAHDDSEEGLIQCGSYTGTGAAGNEINLGWEPQYVMIKAVSRTGDWEVVDAMRGITAGGEDAYLRLNQPYVEGEQKVMSLTPTGFVLDTDWGDVNAGTIEYIYMAIRRPNKPAEEFEPEELFAVASRGTTTEPGWISGFPTDMALETMVNEANNKAFGTRLQGTMSLASNLSGAESASGSNRWDFMDGNKTGNGTANANNLQWMWRRQPGFMDVVTYEGDNQSARDIPHNLGVKPEMMWVKCRTETNTDWYVYVEAAGEANNGEPKGAKLNGDYGFNFTPWKQHPTDEDFHLGVPVPDLNTVGNDYIAYLFASVPGISKVGSYDGSDQQVNIDCGFTTGPRFVLIKCVNSAGDWAVWGSEGGLATNGFSNPYITLNTTAAQQAGSADSVYTALWGFYMARDTLFNKQGDKYIYMAIA